MLEKQDYVMLEKLIRGVVDDSIAKNNEIFGQQLEERIDKKMDEKLGSLESRMDEKLESLESRMDEKLESLESRIDEKLGSLESRMDEKLESLENRMDEKFEHSESFLLDEIERFYLLGRKDIERLEQKIDKIGNFYRIEKLENDNTKLLFQLYEKQQTEIDELRAVIIG